MLQRPEQPYRLLRAIVGTVVISAVVGLWIHARLTGSGLGTLWEVVMLALVIAAGYAVFGPDTMSSAVDDAKSLSGEGGGDEPDE